MADVELSFEDLTFGTEDDSKEPDIKDEDDDKEDKNVLLVSTVHGGKLNIDYLIQFCTNNQLVLKQHSYRDKQSFAFLQFGETQLYSKACDLLNNLEVDGFKITVEACKKIRPGKDPRTHEFTSEFKNSTLVLKNLPFQLKQEKLEELLNEYEWKAQNVSYLYDGSGMFKGMAFVKFKEIEHATKIFEALNNREINGRKLRIEYKRKVQEADTKDDDPNKLYDQLVTFRSGSSITELAFPCGSSYQRKHIHQMAEKLGFSHYSTGEGESRYVIVKKKDDVATPPAANAASPTKEKDPQTMAKSLPINKGRIRGNSIENKQRGPHSFENKLSPDDRGASFGSYERKQSASKSIGVSRSFGNSNPMFPLKSPPSFGTSPNYINSAAVLNRTNSDGPVVSTIRQPKGPDGTNGFSESYKNSRQKLDTIGKAE